MKNYTHKSKYFYGNKISDYGLENGYIDYRTLAQAGDMVLCNDITKLFYNEIGRDYIDPQQVNGYIDNSDEIEQLQEQIDDLENQIYELKDPYNAAEIDSPLEKEIENKMNKLQEQIDEIQEKINSLEYEQDNNPEIFQYYIIDDGLAEILKDLTNEIVFYIDYLDIYIWGVTHYGTSWDYVLTDIKIDLQGGENE